MLGEILKRRLMLMNEAVLDVRYFNEQAFNTLDDYYDSFACIRNVNTALMWGIDDKTRTPLLSVVIPTYNREQLFDDALKSALEQKEVEFDWQIIIIDNTPLDSMGSTPALKIVKKYNNLRVLYYHNEINIGSGYSWNRAVQLARSPWVSFLHDDDVLLESAVRDIGRMLLKETKYCKPLGYINACKFEFSGKLKIEELKFKKRVPVELTRIGTLIRYYTDTGSPSCGTTILREAYINTGGIRKEFGPTADAILGYQIMKNYTVLSSETVLGAYRWMDNESLNTETLIGLIKTDQLFAEYRYNNDRFGLVWKCLFGNIQHQCNIEYKLKKGNYTKGMFKCRRSGKAFYLLIRKIYSLFRIIKAWLKTKVFE